MIDREEARRVLAAAMERGGEFAEVFVESVRTLGLGWEDGDLDEASGGTDRGAGIRLIHDGRTLFANGNALDAEALVASARFLAASLPPGLERRSCAPLVALPVPEATGPEEEPETVPLERKVDVLRRADRTARAHDARVSQVQVRYRDSERRIRIANSDGMWAGDRQVHTTVYVSVVAREGDLVRSAVKAAAGTCGFELLRGEVAEDLASEAARVACLQLEAEPAPAGTFTVVLSSKAGGTMVHEACGHGLEADFVEKGLSIYAGKLGSKVASELVTVIDDGTLPGRRGTFAVDDEGVPAERTVLIQRGVLRGFLHSRGTARRMGTRPTGNGRRQSFRHLPIPRMRNTLIAPGTDDPETIVASVSDGVLVADMGGGEVDIVTGNFVFHCTEAYRIRDGRVAEPLRDAILTGNGPEVLARIDRVGTDLGFQVGTCGKDGQGVAVADAQPTLRIPGLIVGGRAP